MVLGEIDDRSVTFERFSHLCQARWKRLQMRAISIDHDRGGRPAAAGSQGFQQPSRLSRRALTRLEHELSSHGRALSSRTVVCFYCNKAGHILRDCPEKGETNTSSSIKGAFSSTSPKAILPGPRSSCLDVRVHASEIPRCLSATAL